MTCSDSAGVLWDKQTTPSTGQGELRHENHGGCATRRPGHSIASVGRFIILLGGCVFQAGCLVGPNYKKPVVQSPPNYRFATTQSSQAVDSIADLPWWQVFKDPQLHELIQTALVNNYDVRIAVTRVEQASALAAQAKAQFFPTVGYGAGVSSGRNEFVGTPNPNGGNTENAAAALLNAAWEVDIWGRIRRLNESARAQLLATEEAKRAVMLSLVSGVAQAYLELLELDLELQIANDTTKSFSDSLKLFQDRLQGGVGSRLETSRAQAALSATAAQVPEIQRQIALKENQINVLLGRNPAPIVRTAKLLDQTVPPEVPAGLPSSLMERRPDIRAAEQNVRATNAQIGVAAANFFPKIGLTGFFGKVSPDLDSFTSGSTNAWSLAANATGPIFQGGALKAQYAQAKAAWEQARLQYEQVALNAFQEVSNALISRQKFDESNVQLAQSVKSFEESVSVSTQRFNTGKASYFEVLEAQQLLFPAQNALARTQLNQRLIIVQLYRTLGGGWQLTTDDKWNLPKDMPAPAGPAAPAVTPAITPAGAPNIPPTPAK